MSQHRAWRAVGIVLAVNSLLFAGLGSGSGNWAYAVLAGYLPAGLLTVGLLVKGLPRPLATILVVLGSLMAAMTFWVIYPVVLAVTVIAWGFTNRELGFGQSVPLSSAP